MKKSADWTNVALSFLAASLLMLMIWNSIDARGIIFFILFLGISEAFARLRWRVGLSCPHCGFDPLLYKVHREEAVRRVQTRLKEVRASGRYLLKQTNPFQNLPVAVEKKGPGEVSHSQRRLSREA